MLHFTEIEFYASQSIVNSHTHSSVFVPATVVSEVPSTDGYINGEAKEAVEVEVEGNMEEAEEQKVEWMLKDDMEELVEEEGIQELEL